jgi:hypothetical protein
MKVHFINPLFDTFKEFPSTGVGGIKENDGGVNSIMIYLIYYKKFENATMYPHLAQ